MLSTRFCFLRFERGLGLMEKLYGFSVYPRVYFVSNGIDQIQELFRLAPFQFLFGSYLSKYFCPISPLHFVFPDLDNLGHLIYQLLKLFLHHPIIHRPCGYKGVSIGSYGNGTLMRVVIPAEEAHFVCLFV